MSPFELLRSDDEAADSGAREARELVESFESDLDGLEESVSNAGEALSAKREEYLQLGLQVSELYRERAEVYQPDFVETKYSSKKARLEALEVEILEVKTESAELYREIVDYEIAYVDALEEYYSGFSATERSEALHRLERQMAALKKKGLELVALRDDFPHPTYEAYGDLSGARLHLSEAFSRLGMQELDLKAHLFVLGGGDDLDQHPSVIRGKWLHKYDQERFLQWLKDEKGFDSLRVTRY